MRLWTVRDRRQRVIARQLGRMIGRLERRGVECTVCGWTGLRFRPEVRSGHVVRNARCPGCRSLERHRLLVLALQQLQDLEGSCLHLAPEDWLKPLVRAKAGRVFTADIEQAGVDLRLDLEALPFPAGSLEVIICSDVLEHVEDDSRAMAEMRRVLKPGSGLAIVHVPVVARDTVEYGFPVDIDHGHRRAYGPDVAARLRLAGLDVTEYGARQLPRRAARRHGLFPGDRVFLARPAPATVEADTVLL